MQGLLAPPRDGLTEAQVLSLLRDYPNPWYGRGLEVLDSSLNVVADISDYFAGGTVSHDFTVTDGAHRTCNLNLRSGFNFDRNQQFLRPYQTISDGTVTGRFNLGIFRAARPVFDWSTDPATLTIQGSDLLSFLARPIGYGYVITSGTTYADAAKQLWSDAGMTVPLLVDGTNATGALTADKTWTVAQENTWIAAVNWAMRGMGYSNVWVDENGRGRAQSYTSPTQRAPEAVFDFDDLLKTIVAPDRQDTTDQGDADPVNVWIFQNQNVTTPVEGDGQYTVRNQDLIDAQGGIEWPSVVTVDVPDQASLESDGDAQVDAALSASRIFTLHTRPYPVAGHGDVISYSDVAALGGVQVVQELSWTVDLGGADDPTPADTEWRVGTVVGWSNAANESSSS